MEFTLQLPLLIHPVYNIIRLWSSYNDQTISVNQFLKYILALITKTFIKCNCYFYMKDRLNQADFIPVEVQLKIFLCLYLDSQTETVQFLKLEHGRLERKKYN